MSNSSHPENFALSDEILTEMLASDHDWALREIFNRYHLHLFRIADGVLHDPDLAKDLVQDVFIDLWNRRKDSHIELLRNYLMRAIKFQVLKQLRNGKLHERHLKVMQNVEFVNQTEEAMEFEELEKNLKDAVEQLSPRCREVFELSRFENLSHKEISTKLNISQKTVEAQIGKALSFLRAYLGKTVSLFIMAVFF
jgi:RNA polymerase sigma-70 factor (family 1)